MSLFLLSPAKSKDEFQKPTMLFVSMDKIYSLKQYSIYQDLFKGKEMKVKDNKEIQTYEGLNKSRGSTV